jgi:quercetin dioxygenase-like cupin family protein
MGSPQEVVDMRKALTWMLAVFGSLAVGEAFFLPPALATDPRGFSGAFVKGTFDEFNVRAQYFPGGFGGDETELWFSMQKTKGPSDLYVLRNEWQPGGSTGWHTHPGYSFIIVTEGSITAYDGDDPSCTPHVFTATPGSSAPTLIDANRVHLVRNETGAVARATVVQIAPHDAPRRSDESQPANCPYVN